MPPIHWWYSSAALGINAYIILDGSGDGDSSSALVADLGFIAED
jgi:hypothetical protein